MKILVAGAGSIGCYLGARLIAGQHDIVFWGRPRIADRIGTNGIKVEDLYGFSQRIAPQDIVYVTEAPSIEAFDAIFVTVKSAASEDIAKQISQAHISGPIISFQNGVSNKKELLAPLTGRAVLAGMVPFNVAELDPGYFYCGTEGNLMVEDDKNGTGQKVSEIFAQVGMVCEVRKDMDAVLWGKLLMNLNNSVNALSGKPLKTQLNDRQYRRVLAASIEETLAILEAASIVPAKVGKVGPKVIPTILKLPNFLFRLVASAMLKIDPNARSSMADDIAQGRKTEIDYINGAVIELAKTLSLKTPVNSSLVEQVRLLEEGKICPQSGEELLRLIK